MLQFCFIFFKILIFRVFQSWSINVKRKFELCSIFFTCVWFFIYFLFFTKLSPFKNHEKCFLFHRKSSFHSRDNQVFVFLSSPHFLPVSHCFRSWSKENLKVYDDINCLNKNFITDFVSYLKKEIRCSIETLSSDRVSNKDLFMEKSCRKCAQKSSPRFLFTFAK